MLAVAVMAMTLWRIGLGWSDATSPLALAEACVAGAVVYAVVLVASWLLAGRPAGAEGDLIALLRVSMA